MTDQVHEIASHRSAMNRLVTFVVIGWLALIVILILVHHAVITPDVFLVISGLAAVLLGRGRMFIRDWIPFVAILFGWEAMRGFADEMGARVQSDSLIAVERFLFFGSTPTEGLQSLFYRPGQVGVLDVVLTFVYISHFALPLIVAFLLWIRRRGEYYRFAMALIILSFAAFLTYMILPAAPPRFAYRYGEALPVYDIARLTIEGLNFSPMTSWAYTNLSGNQVAAMPSLHAAYPLLAFLFLRRTAPRAGWLMLAYSAVVWFAIVYLAHHYVIDAIAGSLYAIAAYAVVQPAWASRFIAALQRPWRRHTSTAEPSG